MEGVRIFHSFIRVGHHGKKNVFCEQGWILAGIFLGHKVKQQAIAVNGRVSVCGVVMSCQVGGGFDKAEILQHY